MRTQGGDRARVLDAGFDGYVTKPLDAEKFVRSIETFLPADEVVAPAG